MSIEDELEAALREINERAQIEEGLGSRLFTRELNRHRGVGAARRLLQPRAGNAAPQGFGALMAVERPDLTLESVVLEPRFQRLFRPALLDEARRRLGWVANPSIASLAAEINKLAHERPIGELQQLRKRMKRLKRLPSRTIFQKDTTFDKYAFHYGGRTELQFNIGRHKVNDREYLRHGVAISLEKSQSFHDIDDAVLTRIERFNEFIETYPDDFGGFLMYHTDNESKKKSWSGDYPVRAISPDIVRLGMFIFLGKRQPYNAVNVEQILSDFDRLLPLYEYVEGTGDFRHYRTRNRRTRSHRA